MPQTDATSPQRGWSYARVRYTCVDEVYVRIRTQPFVGDSKTRPYLARNGVNYVRAAGDRDFSVRTTTREFFADRRMEIIQKYAPGVRTLASPMSVREFQHEAFKESRVRAVVLNEGLRRIGEDCF